MNKRIAQKNINQVWTPPIFQANQLAVSKHNKQNTRYRLFSIKEIGENKAGAYRLSMSNVIACANNSKCQVIYILSGTPGAVSLLIGVATSDLTVTDSQLHDYSKNLKAAFEGNFLGARLENVSSGNQEIQDIIESSKHLGLVTGVPSFNEDETKANEEDFQGIERLANSLANETWQLIIVAEPGSDDEIRSILDSVYDFSTDISSELKKSVQRSENTGWSENNTSGTSKSTTEGSSVSNTRNKGETGGESAGSSSSSNSSSSSKSTNIGTSTSYTKGESKTSGTSDSNTTGINKSKSVSSSGGNSVSYTNDLTNKRVEEIQKHISEKLIPRLQQGRSKGMFKTAIYVSANEAATYDRLSTTVLSIFQGNEATMTPLRAHKLATNSKELSLALMKFNNNNELENNELIYSTPFDFEDNKIVGATWLTTKELSLIAGLPNKELPGIKIRKTVEFALNTNSQNNSNSNIQLGKIIQNGRILQNKLVNLPLFDLNKHVFVTGVTGAGKTTTCMKILLESNLPFLVIEPAKTEYRALHSFDKNVEYYVIGREDLTPFRLNPFELVSKQANLLGHISTLKATLAAVFPLEAAMPYIVEEAIIKAYEVKGWDIHSGENFLIDEPWASHSNAWPNFSDLINQLEPVVKSKNMGKEFEEKYIGSLVGRLTNLTLGTKGRMLNSKNSIDFDVLLDKKVVIELEEIKDGQDKALFMALILGRLAECMKYRHKKQANFQHLTLIEEAHRLLSKPEPGDTGSQKMGVESFANLLAEVRKYGEGLIIADQIPNKLISDVIKNTHTKIVHRLFSADDRASIGDAMGLSDEQKEFLPSLETGETIVYCGGWHAPVWVKIDEKVKTDNPEMDEATLLKKGIEQLGQQKNKFFPLLSQREIFNDHALLFEFVKQGTVLLNQFVSINHALKKVDANQLKNSSKIREINLSQISFVKRSQNLSKILPATSPIMTSLLEDLYLDSTQTIKTEEFNDIRDSNIIANAVIALNTSIQAFFEYRKEHLEYFKEGKNIFDSI